MQRIRFGARAIIPAILAVSLPAAATVIVSPVGVVQNTLGERNPYVALAYAYDKSDLSSDFTSGVTDFDTYLGGNPLHQWVAGRNEWFAPFGVTQGIIDFDLGGTFTIDRVAVWNEEALGVKDLQILTSNDALFGTSTFVGTFTLTDNPGGFYYPADVLGLTSITSARYVRFNILSAYPDPFDDSPPTASLGEVAFSTGAAIPDAAIPEPMTMLAVGLSIAGLGGYIRKRRRC